MKKALIYGLSAALLLASLTACGRPQADQQNTEPNPAQAAASTQETEETVTPESAATAPEVPTQANPEPLSDTIPGDSDETGDSQPPEEGSPIEQAPEVQLFTDVNETVYAAGTVNIRSSWSASSDRLGSLSAGQSVTRTGKGIAGTEAEGWSRVQLSDGAAAYISNSYLSTTKPVQQQPSSSDTGNTDTGNTETDTQNTSSTGSSSSGSVWDQAFYDSLTPEQQEAYQNSSDQTRVQMKAALEVYRALDEKGYYGDGEIDEATNMETWSQIHVGS